MAVAALHTSDIGSRSDPMPIASADRWPARPFLWLAVALATAMFVQSYHILSPPLHVDEILTKWMASAPDAAGVVERARTHSLGPTYYLGIHALMRWVPDATLAMRGLSLIFGVLCVALVFVLGCSLVDRSFGALACMVAALDTLIIDYAQEARPYTIALAACLFAVWAFVRWRDGGTWWWLVAYTLGMAALISANYVFTLLMLPLGLFLLVVGARPRSRVRAVGAYVFASTVALAALVPAIPNLRFAAQHAGTLKTFIAYHPMLRTPLILNKYTLITFIAGAMALVLAPRVLDTSTPPTAVNGRRIRETVLLGLLWYGVPIAALYVFAWMSGVRLFVIRYLLVYLGGPLLLAALPSALASRRSGFPQVYAALLLIGLSAHLGGIFLRSGRFAVKEGRHVDLRPILETALRGTTAQDLVLFQSLYIEGDMLDKHHTNQALLRYLLAPIHVLSPPAEATMLPLPAVSSVKGFAHYYDEVVGPAVARSERVIVISCGVAPAFERWLRRTHGPGYAVTRTGHRQCPQFPSHMAIARYVKSGPLPPARPLDAQASAMRGPKETPQ